VRILDWVSTGTLPVSDIARGSCLAITRRMRTAAPHADAEETLAATVCVNARVGALLLLHDEQRVDPSDAARCQVAG
jgi:hypothetical protein